MTVSLIRGDAGHLALADESVDLIVTSPPYWALRSYTDGGEHYGGQIGAEPTPAAYIDSLIDCTREWVRVLKPSGSLWVNLGDKYTGSGGFAPNAPSNVARRNGKLSSTFRGAAGEHTRQAGVGTGGKRFGMAPKSLIGLPWRYAIRCIDDLGLILRAEVIWSKPNGLPESVTDRVRRSHETWFHFTREPRYFAAVDAIREAVGVSHPRGKGIGDASRGDNGVLIFRPNPLGKLPGSVWTVATQPLKVPAALGVDHFAAFPMEWPRRIIKGWSPSGICTACGEGRRPTVDKRPTATQRSSESRSSMSKGTAAMRGVDRKPFETITRTYKVAITGEACACPEPTAPTRPAVVLDPFGGTGTTALVAHAHGRHGVSVDMSADYLRLAKWRTTDPAQLAKAGDKPPPKTVRRKARTGQLELFDA